MEYVGNIEDILMEAFDECVDKLDKNYDDCIRLSSRPKALAVEQTVVDFCKTKGFNHFEKYSWFGPKIASPKIVQCTAWHRDELGQHNSNICIVACNHPTQFLEYGSGFCGKQYNGLCKAASKALTDNFVEDLIKSNKAKVFEPKLGDIYIFDKDVIHRTNPNSYGGPHLVLRIALGGRDVGKSR